MMMKKLIPILLLIAFSCKKADNGSAVQMTDVPLRVGDSWSYLVTNYPATETDTAVFKIVGQTSLTSDSIQYKTQTNIKGSAVDSGIIIKTSSSYAYHGNNGRQTYAGSGLLDGWKLSFPMSSNSNWINVGGSIKVLSTNQNVIVAGNSYIHVCTLARTSITPGGLVIDTLLIAPRIGVIEWDGFPIVSYQL